MRTDTLRLANGIALVVPLALLAGAWSFQLWGGLFPCEMCWWQRYAHFAALAFAVVALIAALAEPAWRAGLITLSGLAIAIAALIGGYHAGVEYHWWQGFTACTSEVKFGGSDPLAAIMAAPNVRCDEVQWQVAGISLAGFDFLISGVAAIVVLALVARARKRAA